MSEDARMDWDSYPTGLKVLAVDDDPLCLKVVEQMLRRCNYQVRTAENGKDALAKLRDKNMQIDLVLSDVYMPDMDGFKLLETIGLELDLPVIMMSSNGDTPVVLRGVTHGAVDFLIKPVRIEELRNVWQHVVRRRKDQAQPSQQYSGDDEVVDGNRQDKKRKELPLQVRREGDDHSSTKKPRVVWSVEMHQQFVNAVNSLGIDKAVPKRILDLMNVEGLTRENVASHLQKYRLYLKRVAGVQVQASNRGKACNGSVDSQQTYAAMMAPGQLGSAAAGGAAPLGIALHGEGLQDSEQLNVQLQMQQQGLMAAASPQPFCKQEPMMVTSPSVGPYANGLPNSEFGPISQGLAPVRSIDSSSRIAAPNSSSGLMHLQGSGNYDSGLAHQAYDATGIPALSSAEMMYPEPLMPAPTDLGGLAIHQGGRSQELPQQPSGGLDLSPPGLAGPAPEHQEQDMENFISIFLQPND